jgi:DNA-binding transcriptional MerR regulator
MAGGSNKAEGALRTISEVSEQFGIPQHILRYWETRFPQLRPLQRAGNRRYYRTEDVALVEKIDTLLNREGYTIKGVQKLLSSRRPVSPAVAEVVQLSAPSAVTTLSPGMIAELRVIRDGLAAALQIDAA